MKKFLVLAVCSLLMFDASVLAKGGGGSRSSSSSRPSSFSSSKPSGSFFSKPATPAPTRPSGSFFSKAAVPAAASVATVSAVAATKQSSTFSEPTQTTTKPVAVANTQLSNKMAKQDAVGAKAYASKTDADKAFRQQQASKYSNSFASEPKTRPEYIPAGIDRGGSHYNVVYHGGCYGYYVGSSWTPLDMAMYMVVTNAMLNNNPAYAYGSQQVVYQPVYQQTYPPTQPIHHPVRMFFMIVGGLVFAGLVIFLFIKFVGA